MDFNRLRTFLVVAETGNVTHAARRLFRTQPAITQQMKLFQEELNLVLFEKRKARIFLTAQGKALYEFAKPRIQELEDLPLRLRNDPSNIPGKIRLGSIAELGPLVAPSLMAPFKAKHPKVRFDLVLLDADQLEKSLLNCDLDFGITLGLRDTFHLEGHWLNICSRLPIASPEYLREHPLLRCPEDLLTQSIIFLKGPLQDWHPWLKTHAPELQKAWPSVAASTLVSDIHSLHEMVERDMGIGMGFLPLAQSQLGSGKVLPIFPNLDQLPFAVQIARRRVRNPHWAHDLFDQFTRQLGVGENPKPKKSSSEKS